MQSLSSAPLKGEGFSVQGCTAVFMRSLVYTSAQYGLAVSICPCLLSSPSEESMISVTKTRVLVFINKSKWT